MKRESGKERDRKKSGRALMGDFWEVFLRNMRLSSLNEMIRMSKSEKKKEEIIKKTLGCFLMKPETVFAEENYKNQQKKSTN